MDSNTEFVLDKKLERVAEALRRNNMEVYRCGTAAEAHEIVKSLLPKGCSVAVGGSASLNDCNILPLLRSGDYNFIDRYEPGLTPEQIKDVFRRSFLADVYLCSSNAVTEAGELYNVDGNGNRVAAMIYGPKSVILVVGSNKIVYDIEEAERRVKYVAVPANCRRLHTGTPCEEAGTCVDCPVCTIRRDTVILRNQAIPGRIKVILVTEPLGY